MVARNVTSTGPMMKTTSSNTASRAYAVFSSRGSASRSRYVQRARTADPAEVAPSPATTAARQVSHSGRPNSTVSVTAVSPTAARIAATVSTRAWPIRSIRRPHQGSTTAAVSVAQAVTSPARPKEPVVSEMSSTIPRPVIDSGSRASRPANVKRRATGSARTSP